MAKILANGQPSEPTVFCLHQSLDVEELRQTSPSRILYHQRVVWRAGRLSLSKEIGLLLWLNDHNLLTEWGGQRRLVLLQRKASFEAIVSALTFRHILNTQLKRQLDFFHHAVVLNSLLPEKEFRRADKRRIGVGYRDKGTLPESSTRARLEADKACWFRVEDVGFELADGFPIEGDWVDLSDLITQNFPIP